MLCSLNSKFDFELGTSKNKKTEHFIFYFIRQECLNFVQQDQLRLSRESSMRHFLSVDTNFLISVYKYEQFKNFNISKICVRKKKICIKSISLATCLETDKRGLYWPGALLST